MKISQTVGAIFIVAAFLAVSTCDYGDAVDSQERYHQAVCDGVWPDYLELSPDCEQRTELRRRLPRMFRLGTGGRTVGSVVAPFAPVDGWLSTRT